jgi:2-polyprenyl-3-methyl-5-hydroxy-6-metoxy-1,4-benzoquinol methylase
VSEEIVELQLTGERTLPGISRENYWFARHVVAYELAVGMAGGKCVMDIGCGEGYGPAMLARVASRVVGTDIAPEVMAHARATYPRDNLSFEVMDVNELTVESGSFDLAVSFQVVEHLVDESRYFSEIARVLAPGGTAIVTTPNRLTISPGCDIPINPFHLREYTPEEFAEALSKHFDSVEIQGMFHAGWLVLNDRIRLVDFIKVYEMSKANPRFWAHRVLTPLVRTSDFRLESSRLDGCLDIFSICRSAGVGD